MNIKSPSRREALHLAMGVVGLVVWFGVPLAAAQFFADHGHSTAGYLLAAFLWLVIGGLVLGKGPFPRTLDDED